MTLNTNKSRALVVSTIVEKVLVLEGYITVNLFRNFYLVNLMRINQILLQGHYHCH